MLSISYWIGLDWFGLGNVVLMASQGTQQQQQTVSVTRDTLVGALSLIGGFSEMLRVGGSVLPSEHNAASAAVVCF